MSVTVLARTTAEADALATAVFVLGVEDGLALVDRLPGVEALIVGPNGAVTRSAGLTDQSYGSRSVSLR